LELNGLETFTSQVRLSVHQPPPMRYAPRANLQFQNCNLFPQPSSHTRGRIGSRSRACSAEFLRPYVPLFSPFPDFLIAGGVFCAHILGPDRNFLLTLFPNPHLLLYQGRGRDKTGWPLMSCRSPFPFPVVVTWFRHTFINLATPPFS